MFGRKGHVEVGILHLQLAHDGLRVVGALVVDHYHLHLRRIVLIEYLWQQRAQVMAVGVRIHYHRHRRKLPVGDLAQTLLHEAVVAAHAAAHATQPGPHHSAYQQHAQQHAAQKRPHHRRKIDRVQLRIYHFKHKITNLRRNYQHSPAKNFAIHPQATHSPNLLQAFHPDARP